MRRCDGRFFRVSFRFLALIQALFSCLVAIVLVASEHDAWGSNSSTLTSEGWAPSAGIGRSSRLSGASSALFIWCATATIYTIITLMLPSKARILLLAFTTIVNLIIALVFTLFTAPFVQSTASVTFIVVVTALAAAFGLAFCILSLKVIREQEQLQRPTALTAARNFLQTPVAAFVLLGLCVAIASGFYLFVVGANTMKTSPEIDDWFYHETSSFYENLNTWTRTKVWCDSDGKLNGVMFGVRAGGGGDLALHLSEQHSRSLFQRYEDDNLSFRNLSEAVFAEPYHVRCELFYHDSRTGRTEGRGENGFNLTLHAIDPHAESVMLLSAVIFKLSGTKPQNYVLDKSGTGAGLSPDGRPEVYQHYDIPSSYPISLAARFNIYHKNSPYVATLTYCANTKTCTSDWITCPENGRKAADGSCLETAVFHHNKPWTAFFAFAIGLVLLLTGALALGYIFHQGRSRGIFEADFRAYEEMLLTEQEKAVAGVVPSAANDVAMDLHGDSHAVEVTEVKRSRPVDEEVEMLPMDGDQEQVDLLRRRSRGSEDFDSKSPIMNIDITRADPDDLVSL